jgi:hypothetical protein
MYGHTFYVGVDEHINNVTYPCVIPAIMLDQPKEFESGELEYFDVPDVGEQARSAITIAKMIDIIDKGYYVQTKSDEDTIEIYLVVKEYIKAISKFNNLPEVKELLPKIQNFLDTLERPIRILSNTNHKVAKQLTNKGVAGILRRYKNVTNK